MRILVTGGAGFIGSHLAGRLLQEGHEVRILDSFATGRRENLAVLDGVELVEGDVQSFERAHAAVQGCDMVLHQAALPSVPRSIQDPLTSAAVNTTGTLNVLLAARDAGARRVVFASSSSVYGASRELPKHEGMPTLPISPYAVSKLAAEGYCRAFTEVYDLECVALRYFNVFGPRQDPQSQYAAVVPRFITAVLDGQRPQVFGDGSHSRDFTYIDNVVEANLLALTAPAAAGEAFNIACGERYTLNELLATIGEVLGTEVVADYADRRPGDVAHSQADIAKAGRLLGFTPRVGFVDGIRATVESLEAERAARSATAV
ncbi:MAG TPA: SDR family oxidoreductase [Baekduia sp.]